MRYRVILCDEDLDYTMSLAKFIRDNEWRRELELIVCSNMVHMIEYIEQYRPHLIVLNIAFWEHSSSINQQLPMIWMTEGKGGTGPNHHPLMSKFDAIPRILQRWLNVCRMQAGINDESTHPSIITVWSPVGGIGKTTISMRMVEHLVRMRLRTFYLSLDGFQSMHDDEQDILEHNLAEWLYFFKKGKLQFDSIDERGHEPYLHRISSLTPLRELVTIKKEQWVQILDYITRSLHCDYIIIDSGAGWSEFTEMAWLHSDRMICVLNEEPHTTSMMKRWIRDWPGWAPNEIFASKTQYVFNKNLSYEAINLNESEIMASYKLPYVPEWKQNIKFVEPIFDRQFFLMMEGIFKL